MKRQFKYQTLAAGGTPQPVFATTLTAAIAPFGVPGNDLQSIAVADSSIFHQGDWCLIDPSGSNPERHKVQKVVDSTHIKVAGIAFAHTNGSFVQLAIGCQSIYIQNQPANAAIVYLGLQGMNKSTGPFIAILQPFGAAVQPIDFSDSIGSGQDSMNASDYWFDGTTGDKILPSLTDL